MKKEIMSIIIIAMLLVMWIFLLTRNKDIVFELWGALIIGMIAGWLIK